MAAADSTSSSLILRVQANEPEAWDELVALYAPLVYYWIRRAAIPEAAAVDVGQEVFLAVVQNIGRFDMQRADATFRGWLRVITTNKIRDYLRDRAERAQQAPGPPSTWHSAPAEETEEAQADQHLTTLLPRLLAWLEPQFEPRTWQAFWQTVIADRPATDVAAELGMRPDAVRQAKARILRRLRQEMARLD
jgi:RNA polymerase sigma-70 factor (ECF subfamily)